MGKCEYCDSEAMSDNSRFCRTHAEIYRDGFNAGWDSCFRQNENDLLVDKEVVKSA